MASIENIRNSLISKLLTIKDQDVLSAIDKLISSAAKDEKVDLTPEQIEMLEMGHTDYIEGNVISQTELFDKEKKWLKGE